MPTLLDTFPGTFWAGMLIGLLAGALFASLYWIGVIVRHDQEDALDSQPEPWD